MSEKSEIIAARKKTPYYLFIAPIIAGMYMIIHGAVLFTQGQTFSAVFLLPAGILLVFFGILNFFTDKIKKRKTPKIIIVYEDGVLKFPDFTCTAEEIKSVKAKRFLRKGLYRRWGQIQIFFEGKTVEYDYVDNVVEAENRLNQLVLKNKNNGF